MATRGWCVAVVWGKGRAVAANEYYSERARPYEWRIFVFTAERLKKSIVILQSWTILGTLKRRTVILNWITDKRKNYNLVVINVESRHWMPSGIDAPANFERRFENYETACGAPSVYVRTLIRLIRFRLKNFNSYYRRVNRRSFYYTRVASASRFDIYIKKRAWEGSYFCIPENLRHWTYLNAFILSNPI